MVLRRTDKRGSGAPLQTGESGVDLLAEDVILEESGPPSNGSSRDLIAEGLESGVDLKGHKKSKPVSGEDALDEFLHSVGSEDQSSSVDLGSAHNFPVFKEEEKPSSTDSAGSGVILEDFGKEESAGIELESVAESGVVRKQPAADQPAESGIVLSPSDLPEDDVGDIEAGEEVHEEEEVEPTRGKTSTLVDEDEEAPNKEVRTQPQKQAKKPGSSTGQTVRYTTAG